MWGPQTLNADDDDIVIIKLKKVLQGINVSG